MAEPCPQRLDLGSYVLGALEPAARDQLAEHLADCAPCRAELAALAVLPGLLAKLPAGDELAAAAPADPQLLATVLETARRRRGQRRRMFAAAACLVALGVASAVVDLTVGGGARSPAGPVVTRAAATSAATGVHLAVALSPRSWGTQIVVTVRGVPAGSRCELLVTGPGGALETGAWWRVGSARGATVPAETSWSPAQVHRLAVVTAAGQDLAQLSLPGPPGS